LGFLSVYGGVEAYIVSFSSTHTITPQSSRSVSNQWPWAIPV